MGYSKRGEVALFEEGRGCQRVIPRGEVGYTKRGHVAEGLFERRRGCRRVILEGVVGYTKGKRLLKDYTKVREFAEGLYEEGRGR